MRTALIVLFSICGYAAEEPKQAERPPEKTAGRVMNSLGMELRLVPAGEFDMDVIDPDAPPRPERARARPGFRKQAAKMIKRVSLTKAFHIGVLEVTDAQFQAVLGRKPSGATEDFRVKPHADRPAVSVTWREADEFCRKLSERDQEKAAGRRYRLPTEAEWVRAYQTRGDTFTWFHPPRAPLHWLVLEICADRFDPAYYRTMSLVDPKGPLVDPKGADPAASAADAKSDEKRVCRSSWTHSDPFTRVHTFRVVMESAK